MRRFRTLSSAAALVALTAGTPAHADNFYAAACAMVATTDHLVGQGWVTGVMVTALYASNSSGLPIPGTIHCYVKVNGSYQPGAIVSAGGSGVAVGGGVITFTSNSVTDFVQLCADTPFRPERCVEAENVEVPPPDVREVVDGAACPILTLAAGSYGPVFVGSDGDVYLWGEPLYDCPPSFMGSLLQTTTSIHGAYGIWS